MNDVKKHFLLISDFDGTISKIDFFQQILNKYYPEGKSSDYDDYLDKKISAFTLLSRIFQNLDLSQEELNEEIRAIEIDKTFTETARWILNCGGDICILSAGCDYYINRRLSQEGLFDIPIISNHGIYSHGGICMIRDLNALWYCQDVGIDKKKATEHLIKGYSVVAYAGDGAFDAPGAKQANLKFAKRRLAEILEKEHIPYYNLSEFRVIKSCLEEKNIL